MLYMLKTPKTTKELESICENPKKLLWWMRLHIRHSENPFTIRTPQKVLEEGWASHIEFAWFLYDVLFSMGESCFIVTVIGGSKSAACLFYDDEGKLQCVSNRWTLLRRGDNIEKSINLIDRHWYRWVEWLPMNGKLVAIKPHYSNGSEKYEQSKDTRRYLLSGGGMHNMPGNV